ncbi:hypothetical protein [Cellulomonas hominis]|uniref:hypothetical protein n=1 Tax=Cellulomonas hominis TaxID=156981 RepID=UPI001B9CE344|nr:hypothetical protein [Cellulomonas hominis]VTR76027.1 hypothetical protein CHMI_00783 [Cellulomonas hominis]
MPISRRLRDAAETTAARTRAVLVMPLLLAFFAPLLVLAAAEERDVRRGREPATAIGESLL